MSVQCLTWPCWLVCCNTWWYSASNRWQCLVQGHVSVRPTPFSCPQAEIQLGTDMIGLLRPKKTNVKKNKNCLWGYVSARYVYWYLEFTLFLGMFYISEYSGFGSRALVISYLLGFSWFLDLLLNWNKGSTSIWTYGTFSKKHKVTKCIIHFWRPQGGFSNVSQKCVLKTMSDVKQ